MGSGWTGVQKVRYEIFREREHLLSIFSAIWTVGSRRSKKQSCSMRRGLHLGTDLVEF